MIDITESLQWWLAWGCNLGRASEIRFIQSSSLQLFEIPWNLGQIRVWALGAQTGHGLGFQLTNNCFLHQPIMQGRIISGTQWGPHGRRGLAMWWPKFVWVPPSLKRQIHWPTLMDISIRRHAIEVPSPNPLWESTHKQHHMSHQTIEVPSRPVPTHFDILACCARSIEEVVQTYPYCHLIHANLFLSHSPRTL